MQDVLMLPAPGPRQSMILLQTPTRDVVPRGNALRRRRRDPDEELEDLIRQLQESRS